VHPKEVMKMARVLVMRHTKGRLPPSMVAQKKGEIAPKVMDFLKKNPAVKFNGLWVDKNGVGICDWEAPDAETVKKAVEAVGLPHDEVIVVEKLM
jgi:hypothetical protein